MSSLFPIARYTRQLGSISYRNVTRSPRAQWQSPRCMPRKFSAIVALREKKYSEDHEWVEYSTDGKTFVVGVSEFAAKQLGDVVYVELPTVDSEFAAGESIGAVESVKSANDIMTPVGGKVLEINKTLEVTPSLVNKDAEGEAWFAKFEAADNAEKATAHLMNAEKYRDFVDDEQ